MVLIPIHVFKTAVHNFSNLQLNLLKNYASGIGKRESQNNATIEKQKYNFILALTPRYVRQHKQCTTSQARGPKVPHHFRISFEFIAHSKIAGRPKLILITS